MTDMVQTLVGGLRRAGLHLGTDQIRAMLGALDLVEVGSLWQVYWAGRLTLVNAVDQVELYDRVFAQIFGLDPAPAEPPNQRVPDRAAVAAASTVRTGGRSEIVADAAEVGERPGSVEVLRHKDFATCTPEELATIALMLRRVCFAPRPRLSHRYRASQNRGRLDIARTMRRALRTDGELTELRWRSRQVQQRRLLLLIDVSGSMRPYVRVLLQFAHLAARGDNVEAFCFGTHLTRITVPISGRSSGQAIDDAVAAVKDWEGGTRIGAAVGELVSDGIARAAVVVIFSDGLDSGDPPELERALSRLRRTAHRVLWATPLLRNPDYRPVQRGMRVVVQNVDLLTGAYDFDSLEALATVSKDLR